MGSSWDDHNRRLTGAYLALDLHDAVVVGDRREKPRRRFLGGRQDPAPRRWVQVTAAQQVLVAECVGSTSFGGEWDMDEDTEARLVAQGWEKPWLPDGTTFVREAPLVRAPRLALATVRALELLGCDPDDIEVERVREEPD